MASFDSQQVTGVAVSKSGRVFVNFPKWSDDHSISVGEIKEGKPVPYPNEEWNKAGEAKSHFVCVQSVYVDDADDLWILDPASPKFEGVVKDGPKLLRVNLTTNEIAQTIRFDDEIAPAKSYLNDVRVDTKSGYAFITESGEGSLVVVNLKTGKSRRVLVGHSSTKAEPEMQLTVEGRELVDEKTGKTPQFNADGIALDPRSDALYYHALTGHSLYRIKTAFLTDENISDSELVSKVEKVMTTPAPDGMLIGKDGSVYLACIEQNAVARYEPGPNKFTTIVTDQKLRWPDSMSWGPDEMLYVTASQIQNMPRFNGGKDARTEPYKVYKFRLPPPAPQKK
ncbi:MAG: major royal jelly family protein [Verrucomicrobiota bacterium]|nr:major royal jelly family protein [Verrucomicrobiota bacterium]